MYPANEKVCRLSSQPWLLVPRSAAGRILIMLVVLIIGAAFSAGRNSIRKQVNCGIILTFGKSASADAVYGRLPDDRGLIGAFRFIG
jgi:hypothetical protein